MKLTRKLAALAMAVLLAVSLTACSPKQVAQDMVVHLVHKLGLVEESDEDDTDTTTKAPAGGSVEFPAEMDTTAARVVTYPVEDTLYVSFNGIANRSTEYFVAGGDSMTVTGYATTEASNEKYMYFKIAFWELSDDKTMTSYVPDSTIYYCADGADYQYNVTGLTAGKQYKITISYDNGNKYYVTGGQKELDPTIASLAMCLESVFSALAGWLILGETLSATELCGCALMFGAIVVSQLPEKKRG